MPKLWRRSKVMTDIEFYELRYSGPAAAFLRGFRALYLGLIFNVVVMGGGFFGCDQVWRNHIGLARLADAPDCRFDYPCLQCSGRAQSRNNYRFCAVYHGHGRLCMGLCVFIESGSGGRIECFVRKPHGDGKDEHFPGFL